VNPQTFATGLMTNIGKGFAAGLAATIVLSALMLAKASAGMLPQFNAIEMQAQLLNQQAGLPLNPVTGWIAHFVLGAIVWGGLFGAFNALIPGKTEFGKGIAFGIFAWLIMMIVFMPLAGAGFFAVDMTPMVAVATLVLHLIFGGVLGFTYARLMNIPATQPVVQAYQS